MQMSKNVNNEVRKDTPILQLQKTLIKLYMRKISMISKFITHKTTKTLVLTLATLHGAPKYLLHRLQRVLNYSARIVYQSKQSHIASPLGISLATH